MENQKLPKSNEACWLYSITKNEAIDLIRTQKILLNIDELYYISEENEEIRKSADKIMIGKLKIDTNVKFEIGERVKITYDRDVMETYPAQIKAIRYEAI